MLLRPNVLNFYGSFELWLFDGDFLKYNEYTISSFFLLWL